MRKHAVINLIALCLSSTLVHAAVPKKLNAFAEGERLVYTRAVEAFRKNDLNELRKQRDLLVRNYPNSIHLDNTYYLSGVLQFQGGQYAEAVRDFGVVSEKFPKSNKRPAALFAKAMTYEKLGLKPQAERLLQMIVKEYPGSQESQRAWMQLKVAGQTAAGGSTKR
ncbi:MAG: tetratricopeptide repeat protein [Bdellovibrionales bacterium]|nr:tetratricopeptide repeat protein [Bdellovibrionales bacterium]